MITFANILDPDKAQQNVCPDPVPNYSHSDCTLFLEEIVEKVDLKQRFCKLQERSENGPLGIILIAFN